MTKITITTGFADEERPRLADLYWQAFGAKLGGVLGPQHRALRFLAPALDPDHALVARDSAGRVQGVAGFKTAEGGFVGGGMRDLARIYGWLGTLWRVPLLALLERNLEDDVLCMDGICVAASGRGKGIGTALLRAIKNEAAARGLRRVRLDVIDSNPRARALYEREGFVGQTRESLGPLRHIFGFASALRMEYTCGD